MKRNLPIPAVAVLCLALAACGRSPRVGPTVELVGGSEAVEFEATGAPEPQFLLSTGDVFDVTFLFEPQLSSRVTVRPDGAVALPIMGDVRVAGKSPAYLDSMLTDAYATYFKEPEVTINLVSFAPPSVYVLGEVHNPRQVELTAGMSMVQAVALAGGPQQGAKLGSVVLIRRTGDRRAVADRVDLGAVLRGKKGSQDLLLAPYDIIYVPATFVLKLNRFVTQFFGGLTPAPYFYLRGWEAFHTDDIYGRVEKQPGSP